MRATMNVMRHVFGKFWRCECGENITADCPCCEPNPCPKCGARAVQDDPTDTDDREIDADGPEVKEDLK